MPGPVVVGSALSEETKKERRKEEGKRRRGTGAKESKPRWSLNSSTRSGTGKGIIDRSTVHNLLSQRQRFNPEMSNSLREILWDPLVITCVKQLRLSARPTANFPTGHSS